jgi:hypothetical protein
MLMNDKLGCCTIAAALHMSQAWEANVGKQFVPTDAEVLAGYEAACGYLPADPDNTDNGGVMLDVLNFWRKTGIGGKQILAFAKVDVTNAVEVKSAINIFGGINIGVGLPISAQGQQNIWTVVPGRKGQSYSWGGHDVCVLDFDNKHLSFISWGRVMSMTWGFFRKYCDEGYAIATEEWLNESGCTPTGLKKDALLADVAALS